MTYRQLDFDRAPGAFVGVVARKALAQAAHRDPYARIAGSVETAGVGTQDVDRERGLRQVSAATALRLADQMTKQLELERGSLERVAGGDSLELGYEQRIGNRVTGRAWWCRRAWGSGVGKFDSHIWRG
ncbi:MAG: hypothetical protein JSS46_10175 [Proteobacteria bacterium]|nr:hypothetical protein [Pseudomonadota bacterium]